MKTKVFFFSMTLVMGLFYGCSKEEEEPAKDITFSKNTVTIAGGHVDDEAETSVQITTGNGGYSVTSDNVDVTAQITGNTINIKAKVKADEYTAKLLVEDSRNKSAELTVKVAVGITDLSLSSDLLIVERQLTTEEFNAMENNEVVTATGKLEITGGTAPFTVSTTDTTTLVSITVDEDNMITATARIVYPIYNVNYIVKDATGAELPFTVNVRRIKSNGETSEGQNFKINGFQNPIRISFPVGHKEYMHFPIEAGNGGYEISCDNPNVTTSISGITFSVVVTIAAEPYEATVTFTDTKAVASEYVAKVQTIKLLVEPYIPGTFEPTMSEPYSEDDIATLCGLETPTYLFGQEHFDTSIYSVMKMMATPIKKVEGKVNTYGFTTVPFGMTYEYSVSFEGEKTVGVKETAKINKIVNMLSTVENVAVRFEVIKVTDTMIYAVFAYKDAANNNTIVRGCFCDDL